jgi:archaellum component FlaC
MTLQRSLHPSEQPKVAVSRFSIATAVQELSETVENLDAVVKDLHSTLLPVLRSEDTVRALRDDSQRTAAPTSDIQSGLRAIISRIEEVDENIRGIRSRVDL